MLSPWTIKLLHLVFVFSLGAITLRLFYASLIFDKVRRSSQSKRAELFLRIFKDGAPHMNIPLEKSHYLIGREPECDILLKGVGIPLRVAMIYFEQGEYFYKDIQGNLSSLSCSSDSDCVKKILPGDEIIVYNYRIKIDGETVQDAGVRHNR